MLKFVVCVARFLLNLTVLNFTCHLLALLQIAPKPK